MENNPTNTMDVLVKESGSGPQQANTRIFTASSLREALALIRKELGPDALIMGQRRVGHRVAVEVCLDQPEDTQNASAEERSRANSGLGEGAQHAAVTDTAANAVQTAQSNVQAEAHPPTPAPVASVDLPTTPLAPNALVEAGYDQNTVYELGNLAELSAMQRAITRRLNYAHKPIGALGGRYRFIGASGVGKTSTLIKVLVEWVLRNNANDILVISADQEQLAGTEALQLTCQMLGVSIRECAPNDLAGVLNECPNKSLMLIDTPALGINESITPIAGVQDIWVCSALHSPSNLKAQFSVVRASHPAGVVVTHTDQNTAPDDIANLLYRWRIPLYWLGVGRQLPDAIVVANEDSVSQQFFGARSVPNLEVAV